MQTNVQTRCQDRPCLHGRTVKWGNRFGSGVNCYDCGFSLDANGVVIPASNMVQCEKCGQEVLKRDAFFEYRCRGKWFCNADGCGYMECASCGVGSMRNSRGHDDMILSQNGEYCSV